MTAVALALLSSLAWGFSDFFGGLQSRRRQVLAVLVVTQSAGLLLSLVVVGARGTAMPGPGAWLAWAMGGSLCGVAGLAAFYRGLSTGSMGVVAPISSAAAVVPLVAGLAAGERPNSLQAGGIAVAMVGVVLASREATDTPGEARVATGVGLALCAALGFGLFFVGLAHASEADASWSIVFARLASLAALFIAVGVTHTPVPHRPKDLAVLMPIGMTDTGANLLFALATTYGLLSVVAVLGSVYPVVTVLLARFLLHERLQTVQRVGAMGALVGAAMISAG
jgi:drug/metabolite transporter (DMT)-like permease